MLDVYWIVEPRERVEAEFVYCTPASSRTNELAVHWPGPVVDSVPGWPTGELAVQARGVPGRAVALNGTVHIVVRLH